jgi:hypothetical protein
MKKARDAGFFHGGQVLMDVGASFPWRGDGGE